jgi:hypothetical protein
MWKWYEVLAERDSKRDCEVACHSANYPARHGRRAAAATAEWRPAYPGSAVSTSFTQYDVPIGITSSLKS